MSVAVMRAGSSRAVWTLFAALFGCVVWAAVAPQLSVSANMRSLVFERALAGGLFVTAAVLQAMRWRMTRAPLRAYGSCALAMIGAGLCLQGALTGFGDAAEQGWASTRAARLVVVVPVLIVLGLATRRRLGVRRLPLVATALIAGAVICGAVVREGVLAGALPADRSWFWMFVGTLVTWAWGSLAVWAYRQLPRVACPGGGWFVVAFALLTVSEALRTIAVVAPGDAYRLAIAVQIVAAAVAAGAATVALTAEVERTGQESVGLAAGLDEALHLLDRIDRLQRERLHDARSAVVGVLGASELLAAGGTAPLRDPAEIHRLMSAELARMVHLLDPDHAEPIRVFDLRDALAATVTAHRMAGFDITFPDDPVWVRARRETTTAAVANLIRNAVQHAPGAPITIRATERAGIVELVVDDSGPGIPARERRGVLEPGIRGSNAIGTGSGLGLTSAAAAAGAQGGTLRLAERPGGGTRVVFTLPAAVMLGMHAEAS